MSIHEAKVIEIKEILPFPDPATVNLGLVKVWDFTVVVNKNMWKVGDLAVYIEPDSTVNVLREEFSFLLSASKPKDRERIKPKRLRGVWSEGLLVPAPEGFKEGDDAWTHLELERYEPVVKGGSRVGKGVDSIFGTGGTFEAWPEGIEKFPFEKYDIENFRKFSRIFEDGEEVHLSEKIHGSNAYYFYHNDRMFCGSRSGLRNQFKKKPIFTFETITKEDGTTEERKTGISEWVTTDEEDPNIWWQVLKQVPWIEEFCKANPSTIVFGEIFGQVQGGFEYGAKANQLFFKAFDVFKVDERRFLNVSEFLNVVRPEYRPPTLYFGPYSKEAVMAVVDGASKVTGATHIREGWVIKPMIERTNIFTGRTFAKCVSNDFLLKDKG